MHFLTFDTSLDRTYLTLFKDENLVVSNIIESTDDKYHSAFLINDIATLLKENQLTMQDINAIGVNIGPGSFTGIRACLTIARVIAQQLDCPLIGISSLEILSKINTADTPTTVTMDARKGMCYVAQYNKEGNETKEPTLVAIDSLEFDPSHTIISDKAMQNYLNEKGITSICYTETEHELGKYLGNIVKNRLKTNKNFNWAEVKPLYLQSPSITVSKKSLI